MTHFSHHSPSARREKSTNRTAFWDYSRTVWWDSFAEHVGRGRAVSVDGLVADTGIGTDSVRSYLRRQSCPDWTNGTLILKSLPPAFAAAVLRPADLAGFHRPGGACAPGEALRELTEGAAAMARALADLRIDHTEAPIVRQALTEAAIAIATYLAEGNP